MDFGELEVDRLKDGWLVNGLSSDVKELVPATCDLRLLTLLNPVELDQDRLSTDDNYLKYISREGTQMLLNKLFNLNTTQIDNKGTYVVLPPPTTNLPRSRPLPKKKPLTKWEKFAKEKGIAPTKKPKKVYSAKDEDFRNRWGYKGLNDPREEWLTEIKTSEDPLVDKFKKLKTSKKDRITKGKLHQLNNEQYNLRKTLQETKTSQETSNMPSSFPSTHINKLLLKKLELKRKIAATRTSNASLGVFTNQLKNEKKIRINKPKQKFDPDTIPRESELEKAKKVASRVLKPESSKIINVAKAVKVLRREQSAKNITTTKKNTSKNNKKKRK